MYITRGGRSSPVNGLSNPSRVFIDLIDTDDLYSGSDLKTYLNYNLENIVVGMDIKMVVYYID